MIIKLLFNYFFNYSVLNVCLKMSLVSSSAATKLQLQEPDNLGDSPKAGSNSDSELEHAHVGPSFGGLGLQTPGSPKIGYKGPSHGRLSLPVRGDSSSLKSGRLSLNLPTQNLIVDSVGRSSLDVPVSFQSNSPSSISPVAQENMSPAGPSKRKVRRTLSSILRKVDGLKVGQSSREGDSVNVAQESEATSTFKKTEKHYSWNRYAAPDIIDIKSIQSKSRSSLLFLSNASRSVLSISARDKTPVVKSSPIVRFMRSVHKIMKHIFWAKKYQLFDNFPKSSYLGPGEKIGERELLTFNAKSFRSDVQYETLSLRAKSILSHPTWLRTAEDVSYLHRYTIRLNCFQRYTAYVRKELAKVLYYEKVEKDRVVIRQGNVGWFFYFVVSGSALIEMQALCKKTGKMVTMIAGEIQAGGMFGELALMHRSRRRATIITNDECEFLKVDKTSFDEVLRKSHETEWNNRMTHLAKHQLFQQWKNSNLSIAVEGSQTKEYLPGTVIIKDLSIPSESIFFIIQGSCQVVQKVKLWEKVKNYHDNSVVVQGILFSSPASAMPSTRKLSNDIQKNYKVVGNNVYQLVTKWWVIRTLKEGEYFGMGEGESNMSVTCDQKLIVLFMNKNVFRKHDCSRDLAYLRTEAISWYPSHEEALASFLEWKRWNQYRRNVVLDVVGTKSLIRDSRENYMLAE